LITLEPSAAEKVRVLVLDIDGVLTRPELVLGRDGEELKVFSVKDGVAIKFAQHAGIDVVFLSARSSLIVEHRATMLGVTEVYQGEHAKLSRIRRIAEEHGIGLEAIAYVGDDIVDIEPLMAAGVGIAVADACADVLAVVSHVTDALGGRGAVRETVEAILKARGDWERVVKDYIANAS
jgi:3-deoxy-D-manno-octulosonate 8-phosphate phosphatase (KDO 8-P phosphatase)